MIRSSNFKSGEAGFQVKHDGSAEFNDVRIRGSAIFDSEIFSGPFQLSKNTPNSVVRTFDPQTNASTIASFIKSGTLAVLGQFNNNEINRLKLDVQTSVPSGNYIYANITRTRVYARYTNGTEVLIADRTTDFRTWLVPTVIGTPPNIQIIYNTNSSNNTTDTLLLQGGMWFTYIMTGFTMKLTNIPTEEPAESGIVYRQGNVLMIK